jgi:hypothetical protein
MKGGELKAGLIRFEKWGVKAIHNLLAGRCVYGICFASIMSGIQPS